MEEKDASKRRKGRPARSPNTTEARFFLDNKTMARIDKLAVDIYNADQGRRGSVIHYLLINLMEISFDPGVRRYMQDNSLHYGGDIMRLVRDAVGEFVHGKAETAEDTLRSDYYE